MGNGKTAAALANLELSLPSMVCDGCAERVRTTLATMPGVREVKLSAWRKRVALRYEPAEVGVDRIKAVLSAAGFEAVEA